MGLDLKNEYGQTPIDEDEKDGLKIPSVSMQSELNAFEQLNIQKAVQWTLSKRFDVEKILSEEFVKELHHRMYGDVWKWAGTFRSTNKNIGVDKHEIGVQLRQLLDDARYWIDHSTFPPDEIAVRFKHRLVSIHCFPNGNGRHSRLIADIMIKSVFGQAVFTWGSLGEREGRNIREEYLAAVKKADEGEMLPLIIFARS